MTDLTGKQIANTYKQLLKVGVSTNSGVSTTAQTIQSGDGTNSAMQLSTTAIKSTSKIVAVSICATNDVHVGGNVCATAFFGDGSGLTNVSLSVSSSVAHFTANVLDVPACASITNLVAATGSFTTKVSGVAAEFSGNVCASEYYGDGSNLTNVSAPTSVASMTINTLGVVTAASITSLVAPHGSFTTKVSGVAAEFSGIVSATTFDGALIRAKYRSPDLTFGDPGVRKYMQRVNINYAPESTIDADMFVRYDYESAASTRPAAYPLDSLNVAGVYGSSVYGAASYGGPSQPIVRKSVEGSGFAVALRVEDGSNATGPYSLKGFQMEYQVGARR